MSDLSRTFNSGAGEVRALRSATFNITQGDLVAFVGPSGAGKSTLLNLLGLLDQPTSGSYRIGDVETVGMTDKERTTLRSTAIGFVFQSFHLIPHLSATANVELGLVYQGIGRRERTSLAVAALRRVGLGHRTEARPTTLSGGERQRVAVARATVGDKTVMLCDEPTGNLDTATSDSVISLLEDLSGDGVTTIVITHDPTVATRCDRSLEICDGSVIA